MKRRTLAQSIATTGLSGLRYHAARSLCPEIREACRAELERRMAPVPPDAEDSYPDTWGDPRA